MTTAGVFGGDDDKTSSQPKVKKALPSGWSKLGLTDEQKKRIMAIQSGFESRISGDSTIRSRPCRSKKRRP